MRRDGLALRCPLSSDRSWSDEPLWTPGSSGGSSWQDVLLTSSVWVCVPKGTTHLQAFPSLIFPSCQVFTKAMLSSCRTRQSVKGRSPDLVLSPLSRAAAPSPTSTILTLTLGFPSPRINHISIKQSLPCISLFSSHQFLSTPSHPNRYLVDASCWLPEPWGARTLPYWPPALGTDGMSYSAPRHGSFC